MNIKLDLGIIAKIMEPYTEFDSKKLASEINGRLRDSIWKDRGVKKIVVDIVNPDHINKRFNVEKISKDLIRELRFNGFNLYPGNWTGVNDYKNNIFHSFSIRSIELSIEGILLFKLAHEESAT